MLARNATVKTVGAKAQARSIKPVVAPLATVFVARSLVQAKASDSSGPTEKGGKKIPHDPVDTYGKGVHEAGASGPDKAPGKGDVADVSERVELLKPSTSKAGVEESAKRNQAKKEERAERFS